MVPGFSRCRFKSATPSNRDHLPRACLIQRNYPAASQELLRPRRKDSDYQTAVIAPPGTANVMLRARSIMVAGDRNARSPSGAASERRTRPDLSVDGTIELEHLEDVVYVGHASNSAEEQPRRNVLIARHGNGEAARTPGQLGKARSTRWKILSCLNRENR